MKKLLAVHPDPRITGLVEVNLCRAGYSVTTARAVAWAMELARTEIPDLVLVDEITAAAEIPSLEQQMREDPATAGIPVVRIGPHSGFGPLREKLL